MGNLEHDYILFFFLENSETSDKSQELITKLTFSIFHNYYRVGIFCMTSISLLRCLAILDTSTQYIVWVVFGSGFCSLRQGLCIAQAGLNSLFIVQAGLELAMKDPTASASGVWGLQVCTQHPLACSEPVCRLQVCTYLFHGPRPHMYTYQFPTINVLGTVNLSNKRKGAGGIKNCHTQLHSILVATKIALFQKAVH